MPHSDPHDLWDMFWRDKNGHVVIFEWPNAWLIAWAAVTMVSLFSKGKLFTICYWLAIVLLAIWSVLEISRGVNYFRRALGLVVLGFTIMSIIHGLQ